MHAQWKRNATKKEQLLLLLIINKPVTHISSSPCGRARSGTYLPASTALAAPSHSDSGLSHVTCFGSKITAEMTWTETQKIVEGWDLFLQLLGPRAITLTLQAGLLHGAHRPRHPLCPANQSCPRNRNASWRASWGRWLSADTRRARPWSAETGSD